MTEQEIRIRALEFTSQARFIGGADHAETHLADAALYAAFIADGALPKAKTDASGS